MMGDLQLIIINTKIKTIKKLRAIKTMFLNDT